MKKFFNMLGKGLLYLTLYVVLAFWIFIALMCAPVTVLTAIVFWAFDTIYN